VDENGSRKPSGRFDRDHESIRPVLTRRDDPGAIHGGDWVRGAPWNFRHALIVARIPPCLPGHE
jgi:hypothetical protein